MRTALIALIAAALLPAAPALAAEARATIDSGVLVGESDGQVLAFKGIPFAAPPVGELRWRPPAPPAAWSSPRPAAEFGAICPQEGAPRFSATGARLAEPSEDCLTLNVWAPANAKGAPVAVWIHGGGNTGGSAVSRFYDGAAFAKDGVVLVSIQYRLGLLGFFAHPALQTGEAGDANFGLLDQIAALKWVQRNIKAFGGDPAQVTVMGESAGGEDVMALIGAPAAKGLFSKAIAESPGGAWERYPTLAAAKALGAKDVQATGATTAEALRKLPVQALLDSPGHDDVGPILDGALLTQSPLRTIAGGRAPAIPLMIGSNSGEGSLLPPRVTLADGRVKFTPADVEALKAAYGSSDQRVLAEYAFRDGFFAGPVRWIAGHWKDKAYLYRFDYVAQLLRRRGPDAGHASEIPFVFGTASEFARTADDAKVQAMMHGCWVSFIKTGAPACPSAPAWPAYSAAEDKVMQLSAEPAIIPNPSAKAIGLIMARAEDQRP